MMTTNLLWAILLYFLQPVFIIGLIYAYFNHKQRVKYSREHFRVNFNRTNFEIKDYLMKGLLPGLILSMVSIFLGIPLTLEWYLIYQVTTIVLLLLGGSRFIHPLFTFSISSILLYMSDRFEVGLNLNKLKPLLNEKLFNLDFKLEMISPLLNNILIFMLLILLVTIFMMKKQEENKVFPMLSDSKRGKKVAKYPNKILWVLPMAIIVPGNIIEPFTKWWPLFNIGSERYALVLLPVLVGLHYTVSSQLLRIAREKIQKDFISLFLVGGIGVIFAYFYPAVSIWLAGVLLVLGIFVMYRHRRREKMTNIQYGPADIGLRVIAVRPDSPAERLNLSIGDLILTINDTDMASRAEFNEVLAYNRSYIKLRIQRTDGEIVIAETPLYDDDYNNLGLLLLDE